MRNITKHRCLAVTYGIRTKSRLAHCSCLVALAVATGHPDAKATSVPIANAGFEDGVLVAGADGPFSQVVPGSTIASARGSLPDWVVTYGASTTAAGAYSPNPGPPNWNSKWWSGSDMGFLRSNGSSTVSLSQVLSDSLLNDSTYTLSALIGRRTWTPRFDYALELLAGSTVLATVENLALGQGASGLDSLIYASGAANPLAGLPLTVRLSTRGQGGDTEAFFDNIVLDVVTISPSSVPDAGASLGLFTLAIAGLGLVQRMVRRPSED